MFELANPWLLLLFPLPVIVHRYLPAKKIALNMALKVPFYDEVSQLGLDDKSHHWPRQSYWLLVVIWGLLLFAASGPQWVGEVQSVKRSGRNLMMAIDLSGSMQIDDMVYQDRRWTRLSVVKATAKQFVKHRQGDRLGLILFGSKAFLQTPLTYDRQTLSNMLDDASLGLAGKMTAIGDAIGLAIKRLKNVPEKNRVLILLTDGANNAGVVEPLKAAALAKKYQIKIYTIGIGADEMQVRGLFGPQAFNPSSDLDEKSLQQIAKLTGGQYFRARDLGGLQQIYQTIDALEPVESDVSRYRPITAYYYWPLGLAFILSLALFVSPIWRVRRNYAR